jgi:hypothetical protein
MADQRRKTKLATIEDLMQGRASMKLRQDGCYEWKNVFNSVSDKRGLGICGENNIPTMLPHP